MTAFPLGPEDLARFSGPGDAHAVAIDFETADTGADSACAVGLARIEKGVVVDSLYQLLRPPRQRVMFTWVHGLTWPMLKNQPTFADFWPDMAAFIGDAPCFVAHNASFDRSVLRGCLAVMGRSSDAPFLCTLKGARKSLHLAHNRLSDVCRHLQISLAHHHAGSDALAAALIYLYLRKAGLSDAVLALKERAPQGGAAAPCPARGE